MTDPRSVGVPHDVIRVFPRKTSHTPKDDMVFIGDPPLFRPEVDEVHVSVTFTWDIKEGKRLREAWADYYPIVKIGGPAINGSHGEFIPGLYLKNGITITSRGCTRRCPWCLVPEREGNLTLLKIKPGYVIQDNNLLATPKRHQEAVYDMLCGQRGIVFSGGLDTRLVNDWVAEQFKRIKIKEVFLAADTKGSLKSLGKAVEKLSYLGRNKLRCYVLIAFNGETIEEADERLRAVWDIGCIPFAQLYQPPDKLIKYSHKWKTFSRSWSRPAATKAMMKAYEKS